MDRSDAGKLGYEKAKDAIAAYIRIKKDRAIAKWAHKTCPVCGVEIPYEKRDRKFCSHSCAASSVNRWAKKKRPILCKHCHTPLPTRRGKYCSRECQNAFLQSAFIEKWMEGEEVGGTSHGVTKRVRTWLFERARDRCERCGWSETNLASGTIPLVVNHIDGNPLNHRPENLELICPNCDALTPTYKGLNKGSGREYRRRQNSSDGRTPDL